MVSMETRGQDTRQIAGLASIDHLKVCFFPLKSCDGKSKLFPSCGSVEHRDSGNASAAQRNNTLRGGGGIWVMIAEVYKHKGNVG